MDSNKKRGGAFFLRLALQNIWHNRHTYVPYLLCAALIFGVYLLISGLVYSDTLTNLPSGNTAAMVFTLGMFVFFLFSVCFMQYINRYLISQRKREFGLYGILGLEKRHIGRVLLWENLITLTGGLVIGTLFALLFGRLLFWALLKVIRSVAGSTFSLAPDAFLYTAILYAVTLVITSLSNLRQVRHSSSMELMQSPRRGEKDSRLVWPMAILGVLALGAAYYYAWTIENPGTAIGVFFLLVLLVIFGTFVLSSSGSVVLLRTLQKNKHFYYSPEHYVTVSGLRQRMKQNAKSLAVICILSTMLIVTASGTLSLYLGQENMLRDMYHYDMTVNTHSFLNDKNELVD
ncbi:MAG: ABC transporter permease, partial [Eubacteriales bacterium]|nr:ABC transporter permease [Eubacteriales bacterium]